MSSLRPAEVGAGVPPVLASIEAGRVRYVDFLRRRVGDDAEDVYQQCVIRAVEQADTLRDPALAQAWFWRVLRNAVADLHWSRVAHDARRAALLASEETTPHEQTAACACALGLLPKIPPAYAEILQRVDIDDERVADAALALGMTPDNASVRLHRARKALREKLQGCCKVHTLRACFDCDCDDGSHGPDDSVEP